MVLGRESWERGGFPQKGEAKKINSFSEEEERWIDLQIKKQERTHEEVPWEERNLKKNMSLFYMNSHSQF